MPVHLPGLSRMALDAYICTYTSRALRRHDWQTRMARNVASVPPAL